VGHLAHNATRATSVATILADAPPIFALPAMAAGDAGGGGIGDRGDRSTGRRESGERAAQGAQQRRAEPNLATAKRWTQLATEAFMRRVTSLQRPIPGTWAVILLCSPWHTLGAQDTTSTAQLRREALRQQLEASYITYGRGLGRSLDSLHFEGNVALNFVIGVGNRLAVVGTMKNVVRMRTDTSNPVLTPSFMPRATAYWAFQEPTAERPSSGLAMLRISHHSNGQRGDFFNADGSLNDSTGSFSTNFLELGLLFGRQKSHGDEILHSSGGFSFEWHPARFMDPALRGLYSRYRTNLQIAAPIKGVPYNMFRITHLGGHQLGVDRWYDHFTIAYSQGHQIPKMIGSDFAMLATLYHGMDYYNMRFPNRITMLRFGIVRGEVPRNGDGPWIR
jgi:hypothetical protein